MICDICGVTVGTDNRVTVPPATVVGPTRKGYVPSRLPPSWKPQCEMLGVTIASHWKTVVDENASVDWYLCQSCKVEIDRFTQTGTVQPTAHKAQAGSSSKVMWQCPKCGGILQKKHETMAIKDKVGALLGSATCSYCSTSVPAFTVYDGQFDFADSDDRIRQMGGDQGNMQFDQGIMRWRYKGQILPLACDGREASVEGSGRKWWEFWK